MKESPKQDSPSYSGKDPTGDKVAGEGTLPASPPKRGWGFLALGVIFAFYAFNALSQALQDLLGGRDPHFFRAGEFGHIEMAARASLEAWLVCLAGAILGVGVCIGWFILSPRRQRRGRFSRVVGYFLFFLGALCFTNGGTFYGIEQISASGSGARMVTVCFILAAVQLVLSYLLIFQKRSRCG